MFTEFVNLSPPRKTVAICVPAPEMIWKRSRNCLRDLRDVAKRDFEIVDIDVTSSDVVASRNILIVEGRKHKPDYYFFADSDQTFPVDVLHRLMNHDKDIVGATYIAREPPYRTIGALADDADVETIWSRSGLQEMIGIPMGCLLVKAHVFPLMKKPIFRQTYTITEADSPEPGRQVSEDYTFANDVRDLDMKIWCDVDLSKEVGHLGVVEIKWDSPIRR